MPKTSGTKSERKNSKVTLRQRRAPVRRVQTGVATEKHKSARDRIRGALLKRISEGVYQPGERLKEMTLAREFNVSQAPVREAFRELETLGVLISEHYRGTRVREIIQTGDAGCLSPTRVLGRDRGAAYLPGKPKERDRVY